MQVLQESDLFDLRDAFRKLEEAVMASNLAAVDSAVSNLRGLMDRFQDITPAVLERDVALIRQIDASGEHTSAVLASRLRAFDLAIAAWQDPVPGR
jgi:C4-dicarboxylate-specific signal transduction histidine kinase